MKALSIRQPWAWLIVHGFKDIENRSWNTKFRGRFLVHASQSLAQDFDRVRLDLLTRFHIELPLHLDRGGIVGEAEIYDVTTLAASAWFSGPVGFKLRNGRPLKFVPLRGKLSWFEVDWPPK